MDANFRDPPPNLLSLLFHSPHLTSLHIGRDCSLHIDRTDSDDQSITILDLPHLTHLALSCPDDPQSWSFRDVVNFLGAVSMPNLRKISLHIYAWTWEDRDLECDLLTLLRHLKHPNGLLDSIQRLRIGSGRQVVLTGFVARDRSRFVYHDDSSFYINLVTNFDNMQKNILELFPGLRLLIIDDSHDETISDVGISPSVNTLRLECEGSIDILKRLANEQFFPNLQRVEFLGKVESVPSVYPGWFCLVKTLLNSSEETSIYVSNRWHATEKLAFLQQECAAARIDLHVQDSLEDPDIVS
ncbi:hypothetical protein K439DRAFT_1614791 [Ramaria rubella]|nr:hypothetical protein K439DRAFT_1614791 [Ramaria rubella]